MVENNKQDTDFELLQRKIDIILDLEEDLVIIINSEGLISRVNVNGAMALDFKEIDLLNRHITDLIAPNYKLETIKAFNEIIGGKPEVSFESALCTHHGEEILFDFKVRPLNKDGKIAEVVLVGKNISYLRKLKEDIEKLKVKLIEADRLNSIERQRSSQRKSLLEELNKMKSDFVSNISHELRTPLASIIGFSETIDSDPEMPDAMKSEFNTTILNEGKRLARLINDILDISKLEGGGMEISMVRFNVISMLNDLIDGYSKNARAKNITLSYEIPEVEILIDADKERISQTIGRLLNNAIKFTNEGGRVKVIARNLFKEVEIIITDTGVGIPEADLPYIFQKFYRVNRPGTEIPGTGLGLVFVKQIINLHRGFISVQSDVNRGTTFAIKLPKNYI